MQAVDDFERWHFGVQQGDWTHAIARELRKLAARYGDTFVKLDGAWRFGERNLYVDWIETRSSHP